MVYNLQSRLQHVGDRFKETNGETVTYTRGVATVELTASPILAETVELGPGIAQTRLDRQDWAIDVADLQLSGSPVIPAPGDTITRSTGEVFRVITLEDSPYRYLTSTRSRYRVHSERTSTG